MVVYVCIYSKYIDRLTINSRWWWRYDAIWTAMICRLSRINAAVSVVLLGTKFTKGIKRLSSGWHWKWMNDGESWRNSSRFTHDLLYHTTSYNNIQHTSTYHYYRNLYYKSRRYEDTVYTVYTQPNHNSTIWHLSSRYAYMYPYMYHINYRTSPSPTSTIKPWPLAPQMLLGSGQVQTSWPLQYDFEPGTDQAEEQVSWCRKTCQAQPMFVRSFTANPELPALVQECYKSSIQCCVCISRVCKGTIWKNLHPRMPRNPRREQTGSRKPMPQHDAFRNWKTIETFHRHPQFLCSSKFETSSDSARLGFSQLLSASCIFGGLLFGKGIDLKGSPWSSFQNSERSYEIVFQHIPTEVTTKLFAMRSSAISTFSEPWSHLESNDFWLRMASVSFGQFRVSCHWW